MRMSQPRYRIAWLSFSVLLLTTACGVSSSPSETENIFGPDNREEVPAGQPYDAVGRLDSGCTGTLIGRRLMLTAAHCLIDSATGTIKPEVKFFRPALKNGVSSHPVWMNYFWLGTNQPEANRLRDWAVVRLDETVGDTFGHLGVNVVPFAGQLPYTTNLVGYSSDRNQGDDAGLHRGCYIHEIVDGRLYHDCDGASGISGAPLLNLINGNHYIVAVTVSEFRQGASSSVRRDGYSRDYANVAVPTDDFASIVTTLLQTADAGIAAPQFDGVVEKANPNVYTPEPPPDPRPGRLYVADDVAAQGVIAARRTELRAKFADLKTAIRDLLAVASQNQRLTDLVLNLRGASNAFEGTIDQVVGGFGSSLYQEDVYNHYNDTHAQENLLFRYDLSGLPSSRADAVEDGRDQVAAAIRALEGLIFE